MASITTLDTFGGSSDPLTTGDGWTITHGTGFSEASGVATPKSYAADQGMVWTTGFTEDSANWTTGTICKVEFAGGLESGSEWRLMYDYVDTNNYRYVKILWGGLSIYTDLNDDGVELWKVVSGSHSQLMADTAIPYRKSATGHLGHYTLQNRSTTFYPAVTIVTMRDMHMVKVSAKDPYHDHDQTDMCVMWATDTRGATNGKVGIYSVAGSQTTTVRSIQAQLINLKWSAKTGSDGNSGSYTSPYLTIAKLVENVPANAYGLVRAGTYTETVNYSSHFIPKGTATDERSVITSYGANTVNFVASGTAFGCVNVRGEYSYRAWYGLVFDGNYARNNTDVIKIWAQAVGGTGLTSKYWEFAHCHIKKAHGFNGLFISQGTLYDPGGIGAPFDEVPTTDEFEQFHHVHDCEFSLGSIGDAANPSGGGGIYNEASQCVFEYLTSHDHGENGGRSRYGSSTYGGVAVTNNNIHRFIKVYNNERYGWYVGSGTGNVMDYMLAYLNGTVDGSGLAVYAGALTTYVRNCIAYQNGKAGTVHGNIAIEAINGATVTGPVYIDSCTSADGLQYGIAGLESGTGVITEAHVTNCVDVDNAVGDLEDVGFTWNTNANNHVTADGDPLFNDQANGDFTLQSDSSLLVEAGSAQAWTLARDFGRRPRPQDAGSNAYDIGAFEYPEPASNAPVLTLTPTWNGTVMIALAINDGVITDDDGDTLYFDIVLDNVTTTLAATTSGTGALVTRA